MRGVFIPSVSNIFWDRFKVLHLRYYTIAIGGRIVYARLIYLGVRGLGVFSMEVRNIPNLSSNGDNIIICSVYNRLLEYC